MTFVNVQYDSDEEGGQFVAARCCTSGQMPRLCPLTTAASASAFSAAPQLNFRFEIENSSIILIKNRNVSTVVGAATKGAVISRRSLARSGLRGTMILNLSKLKTLCGIC